MHQNLLLCLLFSALLACKKESDQGIMEPCMEAKIEEFKASSDAVSLKILKSGNKNYYWFNTNARHWDGIEYILDESCDTVCYFCGECLPPACSDVYWNAGWHTAWEP